MSSCFWLQCASYHLFYTISQSYATGKTQNSEKVQLATFQGKITDDSILAPSHCCLICKSGEVVGLWWLTLAGKFRCGRHCGHLQDSTHCTHRV